MPQQTTVQVLGKPQVTVTSHTFADPPSSAASVTLTAPSGHVALSVGGKYPGYETNVSVALFQVEPVVDSQGVLTGFKVWGDAPQTADLYLVHAPVVTAVAA